MGILRLALLFLLYGSIQILIDDLTQRHYARKCGYDCKTCKNWKCYSNWCQKQREKED